MFAPTVARMNSPSRPSSQHQSPPPQTQTPNQAAEDLLSDVINELDRERTKRAELEEKLRQFTLKEEMLEEVERNASLELSHILTNIGYGGVASSSSSGLANASTTCSSPSNGKARQQVARILEGVERGDVELDADSRTPQILKDELDALRRENSQLISQVTGLSEIVSSLQFSDAQPSEDNAADPSPSSEDGQPAPLVPTNAVSYAKRRLSSTPPLPSLPLRVISLLETMPWRGSEHLLFRAEVFEWETRQMNTIASSSWGPALPRDLSSLLKKGPETGHPTPALNFTDFDVSYRFKSLAALDEVDLEPDPEGDGVHWDWVGGWMLDRLVFGSDKDGWLYGSSLQHFTGGRNGDDAATISTGTIRRRRWSRLKVMVSYPQMSVPTAEYLRLFRHVQSLECVGHTLGEQLLKLNTDLQAKDDKLAVLTRRLAEIDKERENERSVLRARCATATSGSPGLARASSVPQDTIMQEGIGLGVNPALSAASASKDGDFFRRIGRGAIREKVVEGIQSLKEQAVPLFNSGGTDGSGAKKGSGAKLELGKEDSCVVDLDVDLTTTL